MKRAPKWWQMFSRKIVAFRLDWTRARMRDVSLGFALGLAAPLRMLWPRGLLFEQLFGHFLVAEALDFCTDTG